MYKYTRQIILFDKSHTFFSESESQASGRRQGGSIYEMVAERQKVFLPHQRDLSFDESVVPQHVRPET